ncbi:MAG TPA: hypothetical protein VL096_10730 [Pirellulaceae bacterium]|nr:hypothetical protein [Pirellulaceae bacterium]
MHPAAASPTIIVDRLAEFERQYWRLSPIERRRLRAILRDAQRLDEQLADLHLTLPAIEVRFYHWRSAEQPAFSPGELLQAIAAWHAPEQRIVRRAK